MRTRRSPPGKRTVVVPSPVQAAATATALVPDEAVSPAPRSQTRAVTSPGPSIRATWTFVRSGNLGCVSSSGPIRPISSGSPTTTACGLPTSTGTKRIPAASSGSPTETGPRSCSTSSPSSMRATTSRSPTRTRTVPAPVRSASQRAAMRVPFPDSSALEPSGFQIRSSSSFWPAERTSRMPSCWPTQLTDPVRCQAGVLDEQVHVSEGIPPRRLWLQRSTARMMTCARSLPVERASCQQPGRGTSTIDAKDGAPRCPA